MNDVVKNQNKKKISDMTSSNAKNTGSKDIPEEIIKQTSKGTTAESTATNQEPEAASSVSAPKATSASGVLVPIILSIILGLLIIGLGIMAYLSDKEKQNEPKIQSTSESMQVEQSTEVDEPRNTPDTITTEFIDESITTIDESLSQIDDAADFDESLDEATIGF